MNIIWTKEDWRKELLKSKDPLLNQAVINDYFKFQTVEEAESYYEEFINSNSNNMNPAFENARDSWLEDNAEDIRESWEENHPVVKDDEMEKDNQLER